MSFIGFDGIVLADGPLKKPAKHWEKASKAFQKQIDFHNCSNPLQNEHAWSWRSKAFQKWRDGWQIFVKRTCAINEQLSGPKHIAG